MQLKTLKSSVRFYSSGKESSSALNVKQKDTLTLLLMLLPCVMVLGTIVTAPFYKLIETSLYKWKLASPLPKMFWGLGNYSKMFGDKFFWKALKITFYFIIEAVTIELVLGIFIAWMLYELVKKTQILTSLFLFPMVLPPIVVALMWRLMYNPSLGMVNYFLKFVGLDHPFLGDPNTALLAVVFVDIWQWTPFVILLVSAGFSTIPPELVEVSKIDGASRWQTFFHIFLPLLKPLIIVVLLLRLVEVIKVFPQIYILTEGGPGVHTQTINYFIYKQCFNYTYMGYSSALGVMLFFIALITAMFLFQLLAKERLFR
jgi:multiple sugar transport system permease protein